ncbi:MAG: ERF family protein [Candidatus Spyradocola sp.]
MDYPRIYSLLALAADEIGAISKDKRNTQGSGFMYRGVDDVMNALHPILSKLGIVVVPEVLEQSREERTTKSGANLLYSILRIRYTFFAPDGSHVEATVVGEAMDSGDKASNKAMSVAFKYACFQVFCIPTEEMQDPDAVTPEPSKPKEYKCVKCGAPFKGFTSAKGREFSPGQEYHMREQKFGEALCDKCKPKEG